MNWYHVDFRIVENGQVYEGWGGDYGISENEVKAKRMKSLRKNGWLGDGLTEFKLEVKLDSVRTKHFNDNDLWGPYK